MDVHFAILHYLVPSDILNENSVLAILFEALIVCETLSIYSYVRFRHGI